MKAVVRESLVCAGGRYAEARVRWLRKLQLGFRGLLAAPLWVVCGRGRGVSGAVCGRALGWWLRVVSWLGKEGRGSRSEESLFL